MSDLALCDAETGEPLAVEYEVVELTPADLDAEQLECLAVRLRQALECAEAIMSRHFGDPEESSRLWHFSCAVWGRLGDLLDEVKAELSSDTDEEPTHD